LSQETATIKEIIVAARTVTNTLFQISYNKIFKKELPTSLNTEINNLRKEIDKSSLSTAYRQELLLLNDAELCSFAQQLIISVLEKEIKNPLN